MKKRIRDIQHFILQQGFLKLSLRFYISQRIQATWRESHLKITLAPCEGFFLQWKSTSCGVSTINRCTLRKGYAQYWPNTWFLTGLIEQSYYFWYLFGSIYNMCCCKPTIDHSQSSVPGHPRWILLAYQTTSLAISFLTRMDIIRKDTVSYKLPWNQSMVPSKCCR